MRRVAEALGWLVYAFVAFLVMVLPDRLVDPFLDGIINPVRRMGGKR